MIYQSPKLEAEDRDAIQLIDKQREILRNHTQSNPKRWTGLLRRATCDAPTATINLDHYPPEKESPT